jgi:hypothetical protein
MGWPDLEAAPQFRRSRTVVDGDSSERSMTKKFASGLDWHFGRTCEFEF